MSTTKNMQLVRFLKGLMDFLYGAMIIAIVALILGLSLLPVLSSNFGFLSAASIQVRIGSGSDPQLEVRMLELPEDNVASIYLEDGEGTLFIETTSMYLIVIANAAKLVFALGLLYVFSLLRKIMQSIEAGDPFNAATGQRIRRLGYAVLAVSFIGPGAESMAAAEILKRLSTTTPELLAGPTYNAEIILASLLILLLSHVWSYGLDLERERALTV